MIAVTEATKTAYKSSSNKSMVISIPGKNMTITNDDIESERAELSEVIENSNTLTFKGCKASSFTFAMADVVTDLRGEYISVTIQANSTEVIPLFKGYIDSQTNMTHQDRVTEFKAYDPLYKADGIDVIAWLKGLTYPITVKNFRDSFFTQISITQETVTLPADSLSISADIKTAIDSVTAGEIMRWICQINGRYGQFGRDGYFHYRQLREITPGLYPSTETYPSDHTYPSEENADVMLKDGGDYISVKYEPYDVATINKVAIYDNGGIDQGQYGSGTNVYCVQDNPIAYNVNMSSLAQILYGEVSKCLYTPVSELKTAGMPWTECGDIILVNTSKNVIRTYILEQTLKGVQALFDSYMSKIDEFQPAYKQTAETRTTANGKKILKIQADIVEMNTLIADRATISQLNAVSARVGTLEADHVTTAQLNAVSARVGSLEADHVSVSQLNAVDLEVSGKIDATTAYADFMEVRNWVSAGYIKADKISADTFSSRTIQVWAIKINGGSHVGGIQLSGATAQVTTTGGQTVTVPLCV